jgi:hypothetical protein
MQKATLTHRSRMISSRIIATACGVVLLIMNSSIAGQVSNKVITWGENTPDWNRALHLGGLRMGCSGAPTGCADYAQKSSKSQGVDKVFLSILLKPEQTSEYVREYSQLSLNHPALYEVGFDDFVSQCERQKLSMQAMSALLVEIAGGLKSVNPNLHLGITVYMDELTSSRFPLGDLDEQFRKRVDFVHLYPHYRKESQSFSASVQRATQIFPSARIVAGVYAYDRRDYLPCAHGNSDPCTNQEELSLFAQSFKERLSTVGNSGVDWIEFYPGGFGSEAQMQQWQQPRMCRPERLQECVENTKAMREVVRQALNP